MVVIEIISRTQKLLACAKFTQFPPTLPDHVICTRPDLLPFPKALEIAEAVEKSQTSGDLDEGHMWQVSGSPEPPERFRQILEQGRSEE